MSTNNLAFKRKTKLNIAGYEMQDLRCSFNIQKTLKKDPNSCDITIYNLAPKTRSALEELQPKLNQTAGIPVKLEAGYEDENDSLAMLWYGDLRTVLSIQQRPDWTTVLTSGDGEKAIQVSKINQTFPANTPVDIVIRTIVNVMRKSLGTSPGVPTQAQVNALISSVKLQGGGRIFTSGLTLSGSTSKVLQDFCKSCGMEFSIQDGNLQLLNKGGTTLDTALQVIGGSLGDGVIGIPEVDHLGNVKFRHLIKNGFSCGRLVNLITQRVQGFYRITKLNYVGDTWDVNSWYVDVEAERFGPKLGI